MDNLNPLQLNKRNRQIYKVANFIIFSLFLIFVILMLTRVIFPSQFFTYSFLNINSLKNTITDLTRQNNWLAFYASTPLKFSEIKINLELSEKTKTFNGQTISIQKSYKSFFYSESTPIENLSGREENNLVSVDDSVFIVGNQKKTPIDSIMTFESLGYDWNKLKLNTADLSSFEKQKLADINAAHPSGTIFKTTESSTYYFVENFTKRRILVPPIEKIKNPVSVNENSLNTKELCTLKINTLFKNRYSCIVPISEIDSIIGKDYLFIINNLPSEIKIKKIDLEFKKSINKNNFNFFLSELKKKIFYRFGLENEMI